VLPSVAAGGNINIQFAIPTIKARSKQITKVATGTASLNFTNLNSTALRPRITTVIPNCGSNTIVPDHAQRLPLPGAGRLRLVRWPNAGTPAVATIQHARLAGADIGFFRELEDGTILILCQLSSGNSVVWGA
jgi:hypothetical protein